MKTSRNLQNLLEKLRTFHSMRNSIYIQVQFLLGKLQI